ncbi:zip zinc transporter family protein [Stylonychia lemnae]|uniref:Zip zinc transporter family protein n=1 Tax=Stylonychia lemnae TaxID=5949 RepID=A0A078B3J4_STYLE|nr:zip zinc transporter family protein [Stylonychia lemnae]|eukprot:CDW89019.1 zip zinc transporter family protein [Stylonychia lemnae]
MSGIEVYTTSDSSLEIENLYNFSQLSAEEDPSEKDKQTLLIIKIVFIFVVFTIDVVFGIIPAKVKRCKESPKFLGVANAFSGGLFLAIALIHILPEAVRDYNDYWGDDHKDSEGKPEDPPVPLPFILVFCGYTLILLFDKVMFDSEALLNLGNGGRGRSEVKHSHGSHEDNEDHHDDKQGVHEQGKDNSHSLNNVKYQQEYVDPAMAKLVSNIKNSMIRAEEDIKSGGNVKKSMIQELEDISMTIKNYLSKTEQFAVRMSNAVQKSGIKSSKASQGSHEQNQLFVDKSKINLTKSSQADAQTHAESHNGDEKQPAKCNLTPFMLMIAMSMHALFEGLAFGLMNNLPNAINLMLSILIHKFAEAMSVSIALQKSFSEFRQLLKFIILFAIATPLGTSLGLILNNAPKLVNIIFVSLAGGTFVYVACSELIIEEFTMPGNRWFKLLAFILGAVLIGSLLFFEN